MFALGLAGTASLFLLSNVIADEPSNESEQEQQEEEEEPVWPEDVPEEEEEGSFFVEIPVPDTDDVVQVEDAEQTVVGQAREEIMNVGKQGKDTFMKGIDAVKDFFFNTLFNWAPKTDQKPKIPPMLPAEYRRPFVICIDMECLITMGDNRPKKRPGLDYFLMVASQVGEVILFTDTCGPSFGWGMVPRFDTQGAISYKFFDDFQKDVWSLERPIEKIIIFCQDDDKWLLDSEEGGDISENIVIVDQSRAKLQRGTLEQDASLLELSAFLQDLGRNAQNVKDIRDILRKVKDKGSSVQAEYTNTMYKRLDQKEEFLDPRKAAAAKAKAAAAKK